MQYDGADYNQLFDTHDDDDDEEDVDDYDVLNKEEAETVERSMS